MDSFLNNDEQNRNETRWDRIEKRHINSTIVYDHSDAAAEICRNLIEHQDYISDTQFKTMLGEKPKQLRLDPNLVMDLRHTRMRRRHRSATLASRRRTKSSIDERLHFQKMSQLNHEIDKFKRSLESIRPKFNETKYLDFGKPKTLSRRTPKRGVANCPIGDSLNIPPCCFTTSSTLEADNDGERIDSITDAMINELRCGEMEDKFQNGEGNHQDLMSFCSMPVFPLSVSIPCECLVDDFQEGNTTEDIGENHSIKTSPSIIVTSPSLSISCDCENIDESIFGRELNYVDNFGHECSKPNIMNDLTVAGEIIIPKCMPTPAKYLNPIEAEEGKVKEDDKNQHEIKQLEIDKNTSVELPMASESTSIPIQIPISTENVTAESITIDGNCMSHSVQGNQTHCESENISPCSSTQTDLRTVIRHEPEYHQSDDDLEFIIKPTITVNLQDTIRSNLPHPFDYKHQEYLAKTTEFHRESKIAVCQQMSILIKKPSKEVMTMKNYNDSCIDEYTEGNDIINEMFSKKPQDNFIVLQKYFLKWVHFTTIEKLKRRNPAQTRLQKMEAFLQNITLERKRALNKLRRPGNILSKRDDDCRRVTMHDPNMNSPRLLERTFNNKIKTQQDIIELQKIKLQRQQRIITELKLSKLLDDTNGAENHLKEELEVVAKYGCANSRSKAKCLQMAGNLTNKDKEADLKSELQAKGVTAPKFLIEMQARALDRQMKHEEAQRRREALEREKEALRIAAEEEKRLLDEDAKRQRIKEYWRKRREEKELEAKKALDRMKFLANIQVAKAFNRQKMLKKAMDKFKNIIKWKIRNKKVSIEMRRRIICRKAFNGWRKHTIRVYEDRKNKAIAFHNHHCITIAWNQWMERYLVAQSKRMLAEDWFNLRLSERVFRVWERVTAHSRLVFEMKQRQAEAHFNWYMKWKVIEHWRRLHSILKIEKETQARRERWRSKISELIPDYSPSFEFI